MHIVFIFGFFASLYTVSAGYSAEPNNYHVKEFDFNDIVNQTLQGIIQNFSDPLKLDNFGHEFSSDHADLISGGFNISNFEVTGLKGMQIPFLNVGIIPPQFNFTFLLPSLNINTDYWADILLLQLLPLYGAGTANNFHVVDGTLQGNAVIHVDIFAGKVTNITDVQVHVQVGSTTFDLHGILNNEDFSAIVSSALNDLVDTFIQNHQDFITRILSPILQFLLNAVLVHDTVTEVDSHV